MATTATNGKAAKKKATKKKAAKKGAASSNGAATNGTSHAHPLDPLTADEISATSAILREAGVLTDRVSVSSIVTAEPTKTAVRRFKPGSPIERRAAVVAYDRESRDVIEATVSITKGKVMSSNTVAGVKPPFMLDDIEPLYVAILQDAGFIAAMKKRGVTDFSHIQFDPWPMGNFGTDFDKSGKRGYRVMTYLRDFATDNGYAHPVENLVIFFDADNHEVFEILDTGPIPVPKEQVNYTVDAVKKAGGTMQTLAPLEITQPEGAGFEMRGNQLVWQKWQLRVAMDPVEGLIIHQVGWNDGTKVRPILNRANLSEMVVPYGTASTNSWWKNAFDAGEVGLGKTTNSLTLGCDCLGEIQYLDFWMAGTDGEPVCIPNAICIHEEDFGILWKHYDSFTGAVEVRRSRRLVVSNIATVGNYEYGFYWYFYLDGTIQLEVKMTGILQTEALAKGAEPEQAIRLNKHLAAPHHQHLFCMRLDFEVDGQKNSVSEVDVVALPAGDGNEGKNGFDAVKTVFETEKDAKRKVNAAASRTWLIENPGKKNPIGEPTAYKLMPESTPTMLARPGASVRKRAEFALNNLWVTPFDADEMRAAGDYPTQHSGGEGLGAWTKADRPIENTDVVVWHTFGASHIARPEDWPVMPVETLGFMLKPNGFFDRNPALDVPPSEAACCD